MEPIILECGAVLEDVYTDEKTGKKCIVILNQFGYRTGYVEVANNVPLDWITGENFYKYIYKNDDSVVHFSSIMYNNRKFTENSCNIYVHGGITFSGNKQYLENECMHSVGFDCAHFNDKIDIKSIEKYFGKDSQKAKMLRNLHSIKNCENDWTLEDVKNELSDLALQVTKAERLYKNKARIDRANKWKHKKLRRQRK